MAHCARCRTTLRRGAVFCPNCGRKLGSRQGGGWGCLILVLLFGGALVATVVGWWQSGEDPDPSPADQSAEPAGPFDAPLLAPDEALEIRVDAGGRFLVRGGTYRTDELEALLRSTARSDRNVQILIQADDNSPASAVGRVMNMCRKHGLDNVALVQTEPSKSW